MKKFLFSLCRDLLMLSGGSSICYGVHLYDEPLAFIVGGAFLLYLGFPKTGKRGE